MLIALQSVCVLLLLAGDFRMKQFQKSPSLMHLDYNIFSDHAVIQVWQRLIAPDISKFLFSKVTGIFKIFEN